MARTLRIFGLTFLYLLGAVGTLVALWSTELAAHGLVTMDDPTSIKLLIASIALIFLAVQLARGRDHV